MKITLRTIRPKTQKILDRSRIESELRDALNEIRDGMIEDFESTVATWENAPTFSGRVELGASELRVRITPKGNGADVWGMLNEGTRPHLIIPRRARSLAFQSGYRAKTRPGRIRAGAGGRSGPMVFAQAVQHPGTEPRNWTGLIAEKWKPEWKPLVDNAMRRATR